jgi:predicted dehydrogenase
MNNPSSNSSGGVSRRQFISTTSTVIGAGALLGASALAQETDTTLVGRRKRYALVGVGSRSNMFRTAILETHAEHAQLVGFCDKNQGRLELAQRKAKDKESEVPIFLATDFDRMVRETKPDIVIVTTVDATHDKYIIRAMELGCDVMTEKPMTTDDAKCRAILAAKERTGRKIIVTFNYRYSPPRTQVKELLMSGIIGDVLSVDFQWLLDTHHGADYFRRWHGNKASSGGLMVHKSTHHFDLVNWWLSANPVTVEAVGKRDFYTPAMAKRLGLQNHHERCHTCPEAEKCTFRLDMAGNAKLKELYLDQEKYDGYFRDRCVFNPRIDIEDTMNVIVTYDTGATLSYSLNAFNAWEGYSIAFNGTKGRIEHGAQEKISISGDGSVPGALKAEGTYIKIFPLRAPAYAVKVREGTGGHGGGDAALLDDLFLPVKPQDRFLRAADERAGAASILTGVAANHSMRTGKPVRIAKLVPKLKHPDYPAMPSSTDPVPMPPKGQA